MHKPVRARKVYFKDVTRRSSRRGHHGRRGDLGYEPEMAPRTLDIVYQRLTSEDEGRVCRDIPETACREQPRNFLTHVTSLALSKSSDGLIDPKLVLAWLLTSLGAGAGLIGLLVPVREAGALLPQMFTAGAIRALAKRKWAWALGAIVQGASALGMAVAALTLKGETAGWTIVGLLAVLALARSVCSVAYKDVLGKTVDRARRGTATGTAGTLAAAFIIAFALVLTSGWLDKTVLIPAALALAGVFWIAAGLIFATLAEQAGATEGGGNPFGTAIDNLGLLGQDAQLRRFILARGLLTSTALAPPFMIAFAGEDGSAYGELGFLVLASASASLVSSYIWGRLADRSSRQVLAWSAASGAAALALTVAAGTAGLLNTRAALPSLLFGLMIAYQGVRLGRATHLVDMATEETRAAYTALSNTIIGLLLLAGAGFSAVASLFGTAAVLVVMAAMAALAIPLALGLDEVQRTEN